MLRNVKIRAFTFLEALVALVVISGGIVLFQSMTQLLAMELHVQEENKQEEWLLFADHLDWELSRSQFIKIENDKIYLKQDGKKIALGQSKKDDFRKTAENGQGYQPMIYGLKNSKITKDGQLVHFYFQFKEGLEREVIYRVP